MLGLLTYTAPFLPISIVKNIPAFARLLNFKPKVTFTVKYKDYTLKTADNFQDLYLLSRLRYRCFFEEINKWIFPYGLDVDHFDLLCDHILIIDDNQQKIVATYRINSTLYGDHFYSEKEFNLKAFMQLPGTKMELGRACVEKEYRLGSMMDILWRGLAEYSKLIEAKYMFGCTSLFTKDFSQAASIHQFIKNKPYYSDDFMIRPIGKFAKFPPASENPHTQDDKIIPPLLKSYIAAGAKIYGEPAIDRTFRCLDYITILDLEKLTQKFQTRYYKNETTT